MRSMPHGFAGAGVLAGCAFILAQPGAALADQLFLQNGSVLQGKIINRTQALLVIRLDSGETRPIPHGMVKECRLDKEQPASAAPRGDAVFTAEEVVFLPRAEYRIRLIEELRRARKSISIIMYEMLVVHREQNEPFKIARALIDARERGVDVRVIFEDPGSGFILDCNAEAATHLAGHGVRVKFDDPKRVTHAKLVVIDDATSILGSHNWSSSGLMRNSESSVLVRSEETAAAFGRLFEEMWSKGNGVTGVAERQRREAKKWEK